MNRIECPVCDHQHDPGDYPDHWTTGQSFEFECERCGAAFNVDVDFEPIFYCHKPKNGE